MLFSFLLFGETVEEEEPFLASPTWDLSSPPPPQPLCSLHQEGGTTAAAAAAVGIRGRACEATMSFNTNSLLS